MIVFLALAVLLVASSVVVIRARSLIHAAVALALGHATLALLFFLFQAPFAGSIQLSVGAGVLSVLFILAISLTETMRGNSHDE